MSVTELVAAAVKYCYDNEVGVPAAANAVWDQMRATTDDATVGELARDGLTVRVQRAVSDDRYLKGPRMIDPAPTPTYREVRIVRPATPSDSQSDAPSPVRVVQFRILEVRYTGRDGNVYPLRKFIRTDVEAVIERLSSDINGKTVDAFSY